MCKELGIELETFRKESEKTLKFILKNIENAREPYMLMMYGDGKVGNSYVYLNQKESFRAFTHLLEQHPSLLVPMQMAIEAAQNKK